MAAPKGYADAHRIQSQINHSLDVIAANSQSFENGTLITIVGGFAKPYTPGDVFAGVSQSVLDSSATNQTMEKEKVLYRRPLGDDSWILKLEDTETTLLTEAMVGQYFELTADQFVDPASALGEAGLEHIAQLIAVLPGGRAGEFRFYIKEEELI